MAYGKSSDPKDCFWSEMDEEDDTIRVKTAVKRISLDDRSVQSDIFKKPACLIYTDDGGKLAINVEVLSQLSRIESKLSVVGICGLYRTGKSYLMNLLAGERTGFALGDTLESETKGIWVWCIDHPHKNNQAVLLVDTEGLDDPEKGDPDHDNKLFCLTMLLSSVLIVNIKGVFDYAALDKLAFITTLSTEIKIIGQNDDEESNARSIAVASPRLLMCIRDFQLKSEKKGRTLTPDRYLEECLELSKKQGRNTEKFNKIKESITMFFPKRKCFLLPQPAMGKDLQNIENLDAHQLTKEFVTDVTELKKYIYDRKPKCICNASKQTIDGADLASLVTTYVEALRNETPIQCDSAYAQAAKQRNKRVWHKIMRMFKEKMDRCNGFTSKLKLQDVFLMQYEIALTEYRKGGLVYRQNIYEDKATEEMKAYVERIKVSISEKCINTGTKWLSEKYAQLLLENARTFMTAEGYTQYETDMSELEKKFKDHMKEFDLDDVCKCLSDFKSSVSDDKMKLYRAATGEIDQKSYRKHHEDIKATLEVLLQKAAAEEMKKRHRLLERELERLKIYLDTSKMENSKKWCSIM